MYDIPVWSLMWTVTFDLGMTYPHSSQVWGELPNGALVELWGCLPGADLTLLVRLVAAAPGERDRKDVESVGMSGVLMGLTLREIWLDVVTFFCNFCFIFAVLFMGLSFSSLGPCLSILWLTFSSFLCFKLSCFLKVCLRENAFWQISHTNICFVLLFQALFETLHWWTLGLTFSFLSAILALWKLHIGFTDVSELLLILLLTFSGKVSALIKLSTEVSDMELHSDDWPVCWGCCNSECSSGGSRSSRYRSSVCVALQQVSCCRKAVCVALQQVSCCRKAVFNPWW